MTDGVRSTSVVNVTMATSFVFGWFNLVRRIDSLRYYQIPNINQQPCLSPLGQGDAAMIAFNSLTACARRAVVMARAVKARTTINEANKHGP